jgi:glyoxylase-like metal-dependent hydrolase (beta-lactamase superfamily II)
VHVSEIGAPHLLDPSRLERSARRLYGDSFDVLWGELAPVPEANVHVAGEHVLDLECFPTPGHASHHVSYLGPDGTLYAGDAAGVRILPSSFVVPPTPPPEFDLDAWLETIDEIERRGPKRLALIHFGVATDVARHLLELRERLASWVALVESGPDEQEFVAAAGGELRRGVADDDAIAAYERAIPFWQSYRGLARYWEKKREAA